MAADESSPSVPRVARSSLVARLGPGGLVAWTIVVGALVRLAFDASVGYGIGESYYVASARHLALSYFDQPPLFLWLTWALMRVVDAGNALLIRLPFVLMFGGTTWLMYRFGARLFGAWAGAWAAVLLNLSWVFTLSIGSWIQPDAPLFLFLLAAAIPVVELAFGKPSRPLLWWALAGVLFGLALLSKYHAALTLLGLVIFVATTPGYRAWFFKPGLLLAAVIAAVIVAPVIVWNAQHDWASFVFQGARAEGSGVHVDWLVKSLLGQWALVGVLIWPPLLWAFGRSLAVGWRDPKAWFLCCLAIVPVVAFTVAALWADFGNHFHWQSTGYVFLFPLLGRAVADRLGRGDRLVRAWLAGAAGVLGVALVFLGSQAQFGWVTRVLPPSMRGATYAETNPTDELLTWSGLRERLTSLGILPNDRLFVVVPNWTEAGKVDVEIGDIAPVVCLCQDPRNIAFVHDPAAFAGEDAVIVTPHADADIVGEYGPYFTDVAPLTTVDVPLGGEVALTLRVFLAHGYRGNYPMPYPKAH